LVGQSLGFCRLFAGRFEHAKTGHFWATYVRKSEFSRLAGAPFAASLGALLGIEGLGVHKSLI
jgi:hypothetical protein